MRRRAAENDVVASTDNQPRIDSGLRVKSLTVTWGAEKFSPIQYQTMDVGPISATVDVPEDMSLESVHRAVLSELRHMMAKQFEVQIDDFKDRVRNAANLVRGGK